MEKTVPRSCDVVIVTNVDTGNAEVSYDNDVARVWDCILRVNCMKGMNYAPSLISPELLSRFWKDYRISTLCHNWPMSAQASQAFSTSNVPIRKICPGFYSAVIARCSKCVSFTVAH